MCTPGLVVACQTLDSWEEREWEDALRYNESEPSLAKHSHFRRLRLSPRWHRAIFYDQKHYINHFYSSQWMEKVV